MDPDSAGVPGYTPAPIPLSHAGGNQGCRREKVYRLEIGISWIPAYAGMTDRWMPQRVLPGIQTSKLTGTALEELGTPRHGYVP